MKLSFDINLKTGENSMQFCDYSLDPNSAIINKDLHIVFMALLKINFDFPIEKRLGE